jgi:hypothetical protein
MRAVTAPLELKAKLERAITAGRNKRRDTSAWEERLERLIEACEVATRTRELLQTRGWCLWRCRNLGDEVIVVVKDESSRGYPDGYSVYTELELSYLAEANDSTLRLVHEAKKLGGAVVTGVEERR